MNVEVFIRQHITAALVAEGFSEIVAQGGATAGVDYYRRCSQASRKGSMYEDCLFRARQWAAGQATTVERRQAKKKPGREVAQPGCSDFAT
ncbi:hypothetical protein MP659_002639 [Salmonella enterica]|nr:hypothetical protein [Salmonella enterica]EIM5532959.1 hypothetical protein [Salmonella enterica subsp. enterica]EIW3445131.1 hypothetical protein [Salmonella enterica]EIZ5130050.1 hypothetical protein [Salmonella enterica]EJA7721887.1 hypothetical protein [Salmonella enterica]